MAEVCSPLGDFVVFWASFNLFGGKQSFCSSENCLLHWNHKLQIWDILLLIFIWPAFVILYLWVVHCCCTRVCVQWGAALSKNSNVIMHNVTKTGENTYYLCFVLWIDKKNCTGYCMYVCVFTSSHQFEGYFPDEIGLASYPLDVE